MNPPFATAAPAEPEAEPSIGTALQVDQSDGLDGRQSVRCPASAFYWAVLEAPGVGRDRKRPSAAATFALDLLLEQHLPIPLGSVHVLYRCLDEGRVLALAMATDHLDALSPEALELSPAELPEFVSRVSPIDPRSLNLLTGPYEPPALRRERSRRFDSGLLGAVLMLGVLAFGYSRREVVHATAAATADSAYASLAREINPDPTVPVTQAHNRVTMELADLRQVSAAAGNGRKSPDAADTLEELLSGWPAADATARTDLLSISSSSVAITVWLEGDPQTFVSGFRVPAAWSLEPPQLNSSKGGSRLSLQLRPSPSRRGDLP